MDPRIGALTARLAELPEREKALRLESNTICYPIQGPKGQPEYHISDQDRFAAIGKELEDIAREKEAIHDKINKLSELLGPSLVIPDPSRHDDHAARLRSTFAMRFEGKICRGHGMTRTPEEAIQTEEYKKLKEEFQPELDKYSEMKIKDEELAAAAYRILSEP